MPAIIAVGTIDLTARLDFCQIRTAAVAGVLEVALKFTERSLMQFARGEIA